jgi:hypothetical protein
MKNITDYKYGIAMGLVILIAAVGIGTAVQKQKQLEKSMAEFAYKVYNRDATDNLEVIVYEFLQGQ